MATAYSADDLLTFLDHAGDKGLIPAATVQALAVAARSVLATLADAERADLSPMDLDAVFTRFANKRGGDFNPRTVKEYARRFARTIELFLRWREDPGKFTVRTRTTNSSYVEDSGLGRGDLIPRGASTGNAPDDVAGTYRSAIPVRPGLVVTLNNIPNDLSAAEAERIAAFVRMLAMQ